MFSAIPIGWVMLFSASGRGGSSYFKSRILKYCKLPRLSVTLRAWSSLQNLQRKVHLSKQNSTSWIAYLCNSDNWKQMIIPVIKSESSPANAENGVSESPISQNFPGSLAADTAPRSSYLWHSCSCLCCSHPFVLPMTPVLYSITENPVHVYRYNILC